MDVRNNTTLGNGDVAEELVQLVVVSIIQIKKISDQKKSYLRST